MPEPSPESVSARGVAFKVLTEHALGRRHAADLIDDHARRGQLSPDDLRLVSELVFSTVRRRATLDAIIAGHVRRARANVEPDLWTLLQLGTCQLALLATPPHAAVNESVTLARRLGKRGWTGFVNGTLRAIAGNIHDDAEATPAPDRFPITSDAWRRCDRPVFPDPASDFCGWASAALSYPRWIVERWLERSNRDEALRLGLWFNRPPVTTLRVNPLRTDRESLLRSLEDADVSGSPGTHPLTITISRGRAVQQLPGFREGHFSVQDESAVAAGTLLAPQTGERVLDLCAGAGTKTCHLAELMSDEGVIIAADVNGERLNRLRENVQRLHLTSPQPLRIQSDTSDLPSGPFDAALIDVPCSNTGVLARRHEVRWRMTPADLPELVRLQMTLLQAAADRLREGGRLVYSTCSTEPEENEALVAAFLHSSPSFRLTREQHHVPGLPADGAYQALLTKA